MNQESGISTEIAGPVHLRPLEGVPLASVTITQEQMKMLAPNGAKECLDAFQDIEVIRKFGILDSPNRWNHFVAQIMHETRGCMSLDENLNFTTTERLVKVWPKKFGEGKGHDPKDYLRQPEKLGKLVYDGYPGVGLIQLTGKYNHSVMEKIIMGCYSEASSLHYDYDMVRNPKWSLIIAGEYWNLNKLNRWADKDDLRQVTNNINRYDTNYLARENWLKRAKAIWPNLPGPANQ